MVKSSENGSGFGSVPPFLKKCYEMVDDESTDSIISWSKSNDSFVIWDMTEFSVNLLSKYFKHNNFSSFIRQLNIYGFRKIDADRWEFANDGFVRGQKHLLKNISRRKHPQVADQQKALQQQDKDNCDESSQENSNDGLWKEVEILKTDKNTLMQELIKLRQHQESSENKLLLLRDRLQGMEKNQQQMLSFLVMAMQTPGFWVQLVQPKENNWRMAEGGNMLELDMQDDNPAASDGIIVKYKLPIGEKLKPVATSSCSDKEPEADHSADGLKDFFISTDFLKVLMDEKMCQLENNSPFILPDSPDDGAWQQLLLGSPFLGNIKDSNQENGGPTNSDMEFESFVSENPNEECQTFESLIAEMELNQKSGLELCANGPGAEKLQSMESLTEQMELLASESNHESNHAKVGK